MAYKPIGKISVPEKKCYYSSEKRNNPSIYVSDINLFTGLVYYCVISELYSKDDCELNDPNNQMVVTVSNFSKYSWIQWKKTD